MSASLQLVLDATCKTADYCLGMQAPKTTHDCTGATTCAGAFTTQGLFSALGLFAALGLLPAQGPLPTQGSSPAQGLLPASVPCSSCGWWLWHCKHSRCRGGCCLGRLHMLMGWGVGAGGSSGCRGSGCWGRGTDFPTDLKWTSL